MTALRWKVLSVFGAVVMLVILALARSPADPHLTPVLWPIVAGLAIALVIVVSVLQPPVPPNISDDNIFAEASKGHWVIAIRWYRALHGVGARDAKHAIESHLRDLEP